MTHHDPQKNGSSLKTILNLSEEVREEVNVKVVTRQRQVAQYYNKRVKLRQLNERDLMLWNCQVSRPQGEQRKFSTNWEGLYLVSTVAELGAYKLQDLEEKKILEHGMFNTC